MKKQLKYWKPLYFVLEFDSVKGGFCISRSIEKGNEFRCPIQHFGNIKCCIEFVSLEYFKYKTSIFQNKGKAEKMLQKKKAELKSIMQYDDFNKPGTKIYERRHVLSMQEIPSIESYINMIEGLILTLPAFENELSCIKKDFCV